MHLKKMFLHCGVMNTGKFSVVLGLIFSNVSTSVESRNSDGGTAKTKVLEQIQLVRER
jgi:hypothetical protein